MGGGNNQHDNDLLPPPDSTPSYWRSEPHWTDEHKSTPSLPKECDILIIGSGMSGVSVAYNLLRDAEWPQGEPSVVMLEARQACSGATGRNGGHVRFGPSKLHGRIEDEGYTATATITEFVMDTMFTIKHIIEKEGICAESEFHRTLDILMDEEEAKLAKKSFETLLKNGFPYIDQIDYIGKTFVEKVTSVKGAQAAMSAPVLSLWPYKFVTQLLGRVLDTGDLNLQTNTPVTAVHTHNDHSTTAVTPRGSIRAKHVVFATNAYSAGLLPQYRRTLIPVKALGTHISVPEKRTQPPYLSNTYNIGFGGGRDDWLNPRPDGGIVVGGGKWLYKDDKRVWHNTVDDSTLISPAVNHYYDRYMQRHFRGWEDSGAYVDSIWTGTSEFAKTFFANNWTLVHRFKVVTEVTDSLPHIGRVPGTQNQYLLGGFNGGGMSLIFKSAAGIADMIRTGCSFKDTGIPATFETTRKRMKGGGSVEAGY